MVGRVKKSDSQGTGHGAGSSASKVATQVLPRFCTSAVGCVADKRGSLKVIQACRKERYLTVSPIIIGLCLCFSACASVDTILLTNDSFPPKTSGEEVAVLRQTPTRPHRDLAELRISDRRLSFGSLQRKFLNRAAALGADAVVFAQPQTQTIRRESYPPLYGPWGYNSPYYGNSWGYGMYGGPYGGWGPGGGLPIGSMAVPYEYDETKRILMGAAIRYSGAVNLENDHTSDKSGPRDITSENSGREQFSP
ncbi:MAG: hypothetical protein P0119_12465 [Nitrospira sp.]|nr:hypothetical protein [Nitrospira sp.]